MDSKSIDNTLLQYREAAIHAANTATSDPSESNKWARQGRTCYMELRNSIEGRDGIVALMSDENPYVRTLAASHSLQWTPERARNVLKEIWESNGPGAFEAKWTLREYDGGTLIFD